MREWKSHVSTCKCFPRVTLYMPTVYPVVSLMSYVLCHSTIHIPQLILSTQPIVLPFYYNKTNRTCSLS